MSLSEKKMVRCSKCSTYSKVALQEINTSFDANGGAGSGLKTYNYLYYCPKCKRIARLWKRDRIRTVNGPIADYTED